MFADVHVGSEKIKWKNEMLNHNMQHLYCIYDNWRTALICWIENFCCSDLIKFVLCAQIAVWPALTPNTDSRYLESTLKKKKKKPWQWICRDYKEERLDVIALPLRGMRFIVQYGEQSAACVCRCPFRGTEKPLPQWKWLDIVKQKYID